MNQKKEGVCNKKQSAPSGKWEDRLRGVEEKERHIRIVGLKSYSKHAKTGPVQREKITPVALTTTRNSKRDIKKGEKGGQLSLKTGKMRMGPSREHKSGKGGRIAR